MTTLRLERAWGGDAGRLPAGLDTVALADDPDVAWVLGAVGGRGLLRAVDVRSGETLREHEIPPPACDRKRAAVSRVTPRGAVLLASVEGVAAAVHEVSLRDGAAARVVELLRAPRLIEWLDDGRVVADAGVTVDPRTMAASGEGERRWLARDGRRFVREAEWPGGTRPSWYVEAEGAREAELRIARGVGAQGLLSDDGRWFWRLFDSRGDLAMERWSLSPSLRGRRLRVAIPMSSRIVATRDDGLALVDPGEFGRGGLLVGDEDAVVDYDPALHAGGRWAPAASCVSPDGRRFGRVRNGVLRVLDLATGVESAACEGHSDAVRSVALSPDGSVAAAGGADGQVTVWDVARSELRWRLEAGGVVVQAALSPDARRLYALVDHYGDGRWWSTLRSWDLAEGIELTPSPMEFHYGAALALSPDGSRAIVTSGEGGRQEPVWVDLAAWREHRYTWKEIAGRGPKPRHGVRSAATFREDGAVALVFWGRTDLCATVDTRTGGVTGTLPATGSLPTRERFATGATLMAKATEDGGVQLISLRKRLPVALTRDVDAPVTAVAIARDELRVLAGTADGRVLVYRVEG